MTNTAGSQGEPGGGSGLGKNRGCDLRFEVLISQSHLGHHARPGGGATAVQPLRNVRRAQGSPLSGPTGDVR